MNEDVPDRTLLEAAVEAAERAAEVHREEAGKLDPAEWSEKGAADFVTEVDREAERRAIRALRARFPHHQIVAEEGTQAEGARDAPAGREPPAGEALRWIIDPLDGTTNFLHGYPVYAASVAGIDARGLRVGVVLNSATGERFETVRGGGARRNGEPIRVSPVSRMRLALAGTGFPFKREELLPAYLGMFSRVLRATSGIRRGGAAALDLCDLACGRLDAFWELWLMPWDIAAGALIVREAGGVFGPLELEEGPAWGEGDGAETLREAAEAAGEFTATWDAGFAEGDPWREADESVGNEREADEGDADGHGSHSLFRGGAYMGANAQLLEKLKRTLSGSPAE